MDAFERYMAQKALESHSKKDALFDLAHLVDSEVLPAHLYLPIFKAKKMGLFEAHYFPGFSRSTGKPEFQKGSEILLIPQNLARNYPLDMPKVYFKVTEVLERPSKEHEESETYSDRDASLLISFAPYDMFMGLNPRKESPMAIDRKDLKRVFNSKKEYF